MSEILTNNSTSTPTTAQTKECSVCGKVQKIGVFFTRIRSSDRVDICKDCLTKNIDVDNPDTFLWTLKLFDIPYFPDIWEKQCNTTRQRSPLSFDGKSVLGSYLRTMRVEQYKRITFEEGEKMRAEKAARQEAAQQKIEEKAKAQDVEALKAMVESGEMSKAQFNTLCLDPTHHYDIGLNTQEAQIIFDEKEITNSLTPEDKNYLRAKWGHSYQPVQWVNMESLYRKYEEEYNLNADREEILKAICKTNLKMHEALDIGDIGAFQKLSTTFNSLRSSGKFTEAQKEEKKEKFLDSIGELVRLCEQKKGIIPAPLDPNTYPQDKVDFTLRDLKAYNYALATEELNLGDLIESYIKKLEEAESQADSKTDNPLLGDDRPISSAEEERNELQYVELEEGDDQAIQDYQAYIEKEMSRDLKDFL